MAGTLYTNGVVVQGTVAEIEEWDAILHSEARPTAPVRLQLTDTGVMDMSEELGTVSASVQASSFGNTISTGSGSDRLLGGDGDDTLDGGAGFDLLDGGNGNDVFFDGGGGTGRRGRTDPPTTVDSGDWTGSLYRDEIFGGAGDDDIHLTTRGAVVDGGEGLDRLVLDAPELISTIPLSTNGMDVGVTFQTQGLTVTNVEVLQIGRFSADHNSTVFASFAWLDAFDTITGSPNPDGRLSFIVEGSGSVDLSDELGGQAVQIEIQAAAGAQVRTGSGDDAIWTRSEDGAAYAGAGNDSLIGGWGNDRLFGEDGDDLLEGLYGDDLLDGGAGNDWFQNISLIGVAEGGDGDDTIWLPELEFTGTSRLSGGAGLDRIHTADRTDFTGVEILDIEELIFSAGDVVTARVDQLESFSVIARSATSSGVVSLVLGDVGVLDLAAELGGQAAAIQASAGGNAITTGSGHDTLRGASGQDLLVGQGGNDSLYGRGGADTLNGGSGTNRLEGGSGSDIYILAGAGDTLVEQLSAGYDEVRVAVGYTLGANLESLLLTGIFAVNGTGNELANRLTGNAAANVLKSLAGNDSLFGMGGNDVLEGGEDNDILDGGAGDDRMLGGMGHDTYIVDSVADTMVESIGGGTDKVLASVSWGLGSYVEELTLTGTVAINGAGNSGANRITGNGAVNVLRGNAGDDSLFGLGGNDKLYGGQGADVMEGGQGADMFHFEAGVDTILDFEDNLDVILVDDGLWGGGAPAAGSILGYGRIENGSAIFDFGAGHVLTVRGVTDLQALADDLGFY